LCHTLFYPPSAGRAHLPKAGLDLFASTPHICK
jgi:hypothetical protein